MVKVCTLTKYSMKTIDSSSLFFAGSASDASNVVFNLFHFYNATATGLDLGELSQIYAVDPVTGSTHLRREIINFAEQIGDISNSVPEAIIICVKPDLDDRLTIAKMIYHKHFKTWISENLTLAIDQWPELAGVTDDPVACEQAFLSNLSTKVSPLDWSDTRNYDLVIDFKTVLGLDSKDLNQIVADFLETPRSADIDTFISDYRNANQQYISYK